jgi:hypothetical protein
MKDKIIRRFLDARNPAGEWTVHHENDIPSVVLEQRNGILIQGVFPNTTTTNASASKITLEQGCQQIGSRIEGSQDMDLV